MDVQKILHACTANIYRDFSNQQISQKMLKVALPIIALLAVGLALSSYFYPNQPLPKRFKKGPTNAGKTPPVLSIPPASPAAVNTTSGAIPPAPSAVAPRVVAKPAVQPYEEPPEKEEPKSQLVDLVPKTLYNGVCAGYEDHFDLQKQSHRWSNPTNLQTLVRLSTEKAYPTNHLIFPGSHTSYIMAEPPKNSEFVDWQADFYRMAIEMDAKLLLCASRALILGSRGQIPYFSLPTFNFLSAGKDLKIDDWTIKCAYSSNIKTVTGTYFTIHQLTISHPRLPEKIMWQLFPGEGFATIRSIPDVIDTVNEFIKEKKIPLNETYPLLVTCENGFNSSAFFILFHELQARITVFTRENAGLGKENIYAAFMRGRSIFEMLKELAFEIQELSTSKAAIDHVNLHDDLEINHMTYGEKPYKDFILQAIGMAL